MTADNSPSPSDPAAALKRKQFWGKLIVFGLIVAFTLLKPKVEAWLQANKNQDVAANQTDSGQNSDTTPRGELGTLTLDDVKEFQRSTSNKDDSDTGFLDTIDPSSKPTVSQTTSPRPKTTQSKSPQTSPKSNTTPEPKPSSSSPLPKLAAPPMPTAKTGTSTKPDPRSNPATQKNATKTTTAPKKSEPRLGALTLVNRQREIFKSTAGLVYMQGSADRHRLKHVLKHAKDDLSKPVHGVYASEDREVVLEWIDRAYIQGQKGGRGVRVQEEGDRTVYTVDMGKKIGYVGGQVGERKGHPACKYLRLVVQDGNEVITAFPSESM